jgi:type VI secretion system protein ImpE
MNASEMYKAGQLSEAIAAQVQEVRTAPLDRGRRLFLFELLVFAGELERARRQLEAIEYEEPELAMALANYRRLLDSEQSRRWLYEKLDQATSAALLEEDRIRPQFLLEPPFHVRMRLDAAINTLHTSPEETKKLLDMAASCTPGVAVELNGKPVASLRDADDLFGTVLEVMARGNYYWVPLEQVESLAMNPPKFPRDLYWIAARLSLKDGPTGEVFLPALYPGSYKHADDQVRLGRATDWTGDEDQAVLGTGLRLFLAGDDAVPLLEFRELRVTSVS